MAEELEKNLFSEILKNEKNIYKYTTKVFKKYENLVSFLKTTLLSDNIVSKRIELVSKMNKEIENARSQIKSDDLKQIKKIFSYSDKSIKTYIFEVFFGKEIDYNKVEGIRYDNGNAYITFKKEYDLKISFDKSKDFTNGIKFSDIICKDLDKKSEIYKYVLVYNNLISNERSELYKNFKTLIENINQKFYIDLGNKVKTVVKEISDKTPDELYKEDEWESIKKNESGSSKNKIETFLNDHIDYAESDFDFLYEDYFKNIINEADSEFSGILKKQYISLNDDKTINEIIIGLDELGLENNINDNTTFEETTIGELLLKERKKS